MAEKDMCVNCAEGILNIRTGAIIMKDDSFLMVRNDSCDYYYSVGGRVKFGETAIEAVIREVYEETGVRMEIDHLGFIHENYFIGDMPHSYGKPVYEIGYYFYMKVPEDFDPVCVSYSSDHHKEYLCWVKRDEPLKLYPEFFRTDLERNSHTVKHIVTDDRIRIGDMLHVIVDRPAGSVHPQYPDLIYPLNYGYVKGIYGGDGEYQDVYILGVDEPLRQFSGQLIAVIHRINDTEDKWVAAPEGMRFDEETIRNMTSFQEQYFDTEILMNEKKRL